MQIDNKLDLIIKGSVVGLGLLYIIGNCHYTLKPAKQIYSEYYFAQQNKTKPKKSRNLPRLYPFLRPKQYKFGKNYLHEFTDL